MEQIKVTVVVGGVEWTAETKGGEVLVSREDAWSIIGRWTPSGGIKDCDAHVDEEVREALLVAIDKALAAHLERLRSGAEDGWHVLPSGGGVRFEGGQAVRVNDGGREATRADLPLALLEAGKVAGYALRTSGGWSVNSEDGVWSTPVEPARPYVVRKTDMPTPYAFVMFWGAKAPQNDAALDLFSKAHRFPSAALAGAWIDAQLDGRWTAEPA